MEHDLHSLLAAARDDAPPPRLSIDDITAAGRQLVRRRRRITLLSSVAGGIAAVIAGATVAVVLAAPPSAAPTVNPNGNPGIATASQSPARRADFAPAAAFETNYTGYTSGRYVVSDPDLVTAGYQQSTIDLSPAAPSTSPTPQPSETDTADPITARTVDPNARGGIGPREGRLVVYGAGVFDPREFAKGEKLQISGKTALLRHAGGPTAPSTPPGKLGCCGDPAVPTIAWQYMPDAWAAIYWSTFETAPTRDELIALAEDLPAADPRPFPVGIRLRESPRNYKLLAVSNRTSPYDQTNLSVVRLAVKPASSTLIAPIDLADYPSIVLTLGVADQLVVDMVGKSACPKGSTTCASLLADGQFYLQVESVGADTLSSSELAQILKSMAAEQPDDRSAWPPASSIFTA